MSLKPGLGTGIVKKVLEAIDNHPWKGKFMLDRFRHEGLKYPLGRYLRGKIDEAVGVLPEERRARVRFKVEELFDQQVQQTVEEYENQRKSKVLAALGRYIRKEQTL